MENRFGFKDAALFLLLIGLIITVWIDMIRQNRQWDELMQIQGTIAEQSKAIRGISDALASGIAINRNGSTDPKVADNPMGDPFRRLRDARQNEDYSQGDWFVDSFSSVPPKLNELTAGDIYSRAVYCRVMESLATYDIGKATVVPLLAESWENADDGLSTTFKLRKNITFSSGDPFTADDVVFSYNTMMKTEITDGGTREYYRHIVGVEKIDDYTVKFNYAKVFYENFLRAASINIHCEEFLSKYSDEEIRESTALLVGTGPYRMEDPTTYTPGETITVVRNNRYWGVPGPWDRIIWKIIKAESAREIEFRNKGLDIMAPLPNQHIDMLKDKDLVARTQHKVYEHVRTGYTYVSWNQKRKGEATVFANKRVRQAMTMLFDRQRIIDEIYLGFGRIASGPFHHMGPQFNEEVKPWPYDPKRAIAVLKEEGFTQDENGRVHQPDGKPFDIELTYGAGSKFVEKIALSLKDNLARAGINLKLNPLEWPIMLERLNQKDFDAITLGWGAGGLESDVEQMFHSRTIKEGDNRGSYINTELDALIEKAHITLDFDERMKIWKQIHAILHEDQPYTFMARSTVRLWLDNRIQNLQEIPVFGVNYVSTWSVPLEWYVPLKDQKHN